jgi:acyl-CoA thioester hydrolase
MPREHDLEIRVRYSETDAMGFLHHANFFNYFEMGRIELLRASGGNYAKMEEQGLFIVVVEIRCRYRSPARYDELLTLRTKLVRVTAARLEHEYQVFRGETLLAEGNSVLACVDKSGQLQRVPEEFQIPPAE